MGVAMTNYTFPEGQEYFDPIPDESTWSESFWGTNLAEGHMDDAEYRLSKDDDWVGADSFTVDGGTYAGLDLYLKLNYSFDDAVPVIDDPFVCYKLPSNITLNQNTYGNKAIVTDPNYSGTAGYYFITKTGLVVMLRQMGMAILL